MVDIGCGSGQSTATFAPHFTQAVGIDPSECQIQLARETNELPNIEFRVGTAERLPFPEESVSLVSAMCAAHWFHLPKFYSERHRVLQAGGIIAMGIYKTLADFACMKDPIWDTEEENDIKTGKLLEAVAEFEDQLEWPVSSLLAYQLFLLQAVHMILKCP